MDLIQTYIPESQICRFGFVPKKYSFHLCLGGEVDWRCEGENGEIIHFCLVLEARVMVDGSNVVDICPGVCVIMFSNADLHRGGGVASCAVGRGEHMAAGDEGPTAPGGAVPRVHQAHLR